MQLPSLLTHVSIISPYYFYSELLLIILNYYPSNSIHLTLILITSILHQLTTIVLFEFITILF